MSAGRGPRVDRPRVDLHSHAGRCFLAGLPAAHRDFHAGEAYEDTQRQLAGIRQAVAEAGAEVATSAADLDRAVRDGRTAVLLGCEGGDFLEGELGRLEEARAAGLTVLTLVHYRVSDIGDVQTEKPVHDGLSRFGRDVVAECNRLGIVVDCAHASFATTMAVLEPSGPDQLRPARRPDRPAGRPRPPDGPHPADPRRQCPETPGPHALTGIYTAEAGLRGWAAR